MEFMTDQRPRRLIEKLQEDEYDHDSKLIDQIQALNCLTNDKFEDERKNSLGIRISKCILIFFGKFLHLDYYDKRLEIGDGATKSRSDEQQIKRQFLREVCKIQFIVYLIIWIWISVSTIFQYRYDVESFKLNRLRARLVDRTGHEQDHSSKHNNLSIVKSMLEQSVRVSDAEKDLRSIGAPFISMHFNLVVLYVYLLIVSGSTYFHAFIRLNATSLVFNFPLARFILDPQRERRHYSKLIAIEFATFVTSSWTFIRASNSLGKSAELTANLPSITNIVKPNRTTTRSIFRRSVKVFLPTVSESVNQLYQQLLDHRTIVDQLFQMTCNGSLQPLNWSHSFAFKLPESYGIFISMMVVYVIILLEFARQMIIRSSDCELQKGTMDLMVLVLVILLLAYTAIAVIYYVSYVLFDTLDQIYYIKSLINLIEQLIEWNKARLLNLSNVLDSHGVRKNKRLMFSKVSQFIQIDGKQMNSNALFAFMHFKLFVAQFRKHKESSSLAIMTTMILFFLMPIVSRLHVPYVEANSFKYMCIGISLSTVILFNCTNVPVCYFHSRSLKLYKSLNSLKAHTVDTSSWLISLEHSSKLIYNQHLVWLLQKELEHPDRLTKRFAFKMAGMEFTYRNSVRVHFWFGIVVLSIICSMNSAKSSAFLEYFLKDPFGLFSWP